MPEWMRIIIMMGIIWAAVMAYRGRFGRAPEKQVSGTGKAPKEVRR